MKKLVLIFSIFSMLFLFSCQKGDVTDDDINTAESAATADNAEADGFFFAQSSTDKNKAYVLDDSSDIASCYSVSTIINTDGSFTTTLTFNGEACPTDEVVREGTIKITWYLGWQTKFIDKPLTIEYINFKRNNKTVNGTVTVTFNSADTVYVELLDSTMVVPSFTFKSNMSITFEDGTEFTWEGTRTVKYLRGFYTPFIWRDNILQVDANRTGVNRKGEHYTAVSSGIIWKADCAYKLPISGTRTITVENKEPIVIDYGDGTCDQYYTITKGDKTITVDITKDN